MGGDRCDFKRSKECESVVEKAAEDKWNSMSEAEKSPFVKKASEMVAAMDRAAEFYKMITNAPKATAAAAPPTEEKLSEAATTGGPME
ncbi:HMG1/2-like protein [Syzygium oleosum]|uniref:HMG1/2-like protein n=1 Tax=Syzygium oleosum TaxID=219896 RepID=UPI0024BAB818|nr:HMG1/2-like protein [Syzygium oleosum]